MNLTRYWNVAHKDHKIEVQWTGLRFADGWQLSLLVDGKSQGVRKDRKSDILLEGSAGGDPISIHFQQGLFRNRCIISANGTVIQNSTQPWNALAFGFVFALGPVLGFTFFRVARDVIVGLSSKL